MSPEATIALVAPLVIVELALKFLALQDLWKRDDLPRNVQMSWTAAIVLVSALGWLTYFLAGRQRRSSA